MYCLLLIYLLAPLVHAEDTEETEIGKAKHHHHHDKSLRQKKNQEPSSNSTDVMFTLFDMLNQVYQKAGRLTVKQLNDKFERQKIKARNAKQQRKQVNRMLEPMRRLLETEQNEKLKKVETGNAFKVTSEILKDREPSADDRDSFNEKEQSELIKVLDEMGGLLSKLDDSFHDTESHGARTRRSIDDVNSVGMNTTLSLRRSLDDVNPNGATRDSQNNATNEDVILIGSQTKALQMDSPQSVDANENVETRRTYTEQRIKPHILSLMPKTFHEIDDKIKLSTKFKNQYTNDDKYQIGYIVANIDTLDLNLRTIEKDINENHKNWNDDKVLSIFLKLKNINEITASLNNRLVEYDRKINAPKTPRSTSIRDGFYQYS